MLVQAARLGRHPEGAPLTLPLTLPLTSGAIQKGAPLTLPLTSGAIQKGVPTKVQHLDMVAVSWPATPKSASFTCLGVGVGVGASFTCADHAGGRA